MELQDKIKEMRKYTYYDLSETMDSIIYYIAKYKERPKNRENFDAASNTLKEVRGYYEKIPLDILHNEDDDFAYLSMINTLLKKVKESLDSLLKNESQESFENLRRISSIVIDIWDLYNTNLQDYENIQRMLHPENIDFNQPETTKCKILKLDDFRKKI